MQIELKELAQAIGIGIAMPVSFILIAYVILRIKYAYFRKHAEIIFADYMQKMVDEKQIGKYFALSIVITLTIFAIILF